jgi:gliding motility-associated-like protein
VFYTSGGFKIVRLTTNFRGCEHDTVFSFRVEESPILSAGPDKEFCEGDGGVQLDATSTGGLQPYTYAWSCDVGGCGISSPTAEDPFVNPLAIAPDTVRYLAQVTDARGCKSNPDWADVVVHPKPKVNAGPDDTLCAQGPGIVLQGGLAVANRAVGPFSWQWTDSAGNVPPPGILPPNDKQPIAYTRPEKTTIYVLLATDLSTGCSSQPTTVNPLSTAVVLVRDSLFAFAGRDTLICFGDTIRLNGFGFGGAGPYDYSWTPIGTGYFEDPTKPDPLVSPQQTTTYTLVSATDECFSPGSQITVSVENIPTVEAGNNLSICQGDTIRLIGQASGSPLPANSAYTYQWSPARGLNDRSIRNPLAFPDTTTTYRITAVSNQGCGSAFDDMVLTVKSTPNAHVITPDTLICIGDEITLKSEHDFDNTVPASPVIYQWSPTATIIGSTFGPNIRVKPDESVTYTVRTTYAGCSTTDQVNISVSPQPMAQIMASDSVICSGELVNLQASGGFGNSQYTWSPAASLDDVSSASPIATPDTFTRYYLNIKEGACNSIDSIDIQVFPQPEAEFLHSQPEGCVGLSVSFLATSEDAIAYVWDFGDGSPLNNEPNPIHQYNQVGEFPVVLTVVGAGGCESTASLVTVKVGESIFADFESEPVPGSQLTLPDALVIFLDKSRNGINWLWDFGDGESSTAVNPVHTYYEPGEFDVTLTVTDSNGCVSSITYGPYVVFEPDLFIPNVFSPNGDNINDKFEIVYTGVEQFRLEIFDRWGRAYFSSESPEDLWAGTTLDGGEATEGVYYYALMIGGKIIKGNVTLLR